VTSYEILTYDKPPEADESRAGEAYNQFHT